MKIFFNKKFKGGMSPIIATVLLIALVIVMVSVLWIVITTFISNETDPTTACFGILDKVKLDYACYNVIDNSTTFYISIGDIEVEEILVSISSNDDGRTFVIKNEKLVIDDVDFFPAQDGNVSLPSKNSGYRYKLYGFSSSHPSRMQGMPEIIQISPLVNGHQCEVSSTINPIYNC
ncbi:hypothetical protein K0A97_03395 [Patescibacteria group bacterium]|nr:hypothetical protein [Patescibacteria group bacterium]